MKDRDVQNIKPLSQLEVLYLSRNQITDTGVRALINCLPNLRVLDLSRNTGITSNGVRAVLQSCPLLRQIFLYKTFVRGREIEEFRMQFPNIQIIDKDNLKSSTSD